MRYLVLWFGVALLLASCGETTSPSFTAGTALTAAKTAFASLPAATFGKTAPTRTTQRTPSVRDSNCSDTGAPQTNAGADMARTDPGFAAATAYCTIIFNTVSPDSVQGAMNIASGMSCTANNAGLFSNLPAGATNTTIKDVVIDTTCFGNQAEVNRLTADMGVSTIANVTLAVADLSNTINEYQFKLSFTLGNETASIFISANGSTIAALNADDDSWAFKLDTTSGVLIYESIDATNVRRMRFLINGTFGSSGSLLSVSSVSGFWLQGGGSDWSSFVTFVGNQTEGILENIYNNSGSFSQPVSNNCVNGSCTGLTGISASESEIDNLTAGISVANTAQRNATTLLSLSTINPTTNSTYAR